MKRIQVLITALVAAAVFIPSCGGSGGGDGFEWGAIGSANVLRPIALFADTLYVDYNPGDSWREASVLEEALRDMGHTVTPFTGTTEADFLAAMRDKEVLIIPKLEYGDLNAVLDAKTRNLVRGFVESGGILVVTSVSPSVGAYTEDLINDTFGYSIITTAAATHTTLTYDSTEAAGTPFEGAVPLTLYAPEATFTIDTNTLPTDARVVYNDPSGNAALVYIPREDGHIVIMGWDWYEGKPVGTEDHGWWGVLYRTVSIGADFPDAAVLHAHSGSTYTDDIIDKLLRSGQFETVDRIDVLNSTPGLTTLQSYDTVLVSADDYFSDDVILGNNLADYLDSGGGVVLAMFSMYFGPEGRFSDDEYFCIPEGSGQKMGSAYLGTTYYSVHPSLAGVQTFFGGSSSFRANTMDVFPGAARIANWDDGTPLLATREINGVRRADLGFYPVSADVVSNFWDTTTDGVLLMANTLTWAADLPEPDYLTAISADSFPMPIDSPPGSGCDISSTVIVSGGPESISRITVTLDISHSWVEDLDITLESPEGTILDISSDNGDDGQDYSNATFDDAAGNAIGSLTDGIYTPFTGSYMPEQALANLRGEDSNGTWTLHIADDHCSMDGGAGLNGWSLNVR